MKINQPVTNNEAPIAEGTIVVSKTTPAGIITFCNDEFINVSGFSEEEVIGKSHNIVRHPSMPPAIFADLWNTIQRGEPWSGIVKNRCKNGDYYWLYANVTPIFEQGKIVEFMSVRTKPTPQQVADASKAYDKMWQTETGKKTSPHAAKTWRQRIEQTSISRKLLAFTLITVSLQLLGIAAWLTGVPNSVLAILMTLPVITIILGGLWMHAQLSQPLRYISLKLRSLLDGHVFDWIDATRNDEFGRIMKQLRMLQIKLGFDLVDSNGTVLHLLELVSKMGTLTQRFNNTATSMEESAANMTEINSLTKNSAQNTIDADHMANQAMQRVENSRLAMNKAVEAMSAINEATRKIANIIGVIDEIAFKTNLLALNASVEAAHAGDQGKGFAVVADEVRNLSQHTAGAASEVMKLIEDSINKVKDGSSIIDRSSTALQDVVTEVERVSKLISEISLSSKEQTIGIEMLAQNIQTINETLQHSTHMIEETSSQSQRIGKRAEDFVAQGRIRGAA